MPNNRHKRKSLSMALEIQLLLSFSDYRLITGAERNKKDSQNPFSCLRNQNCWLNQYVNEMICD